MHAKTEVVRIEYSLPSEGRNQLASWQTGSEVRFADDRAFQNRRNAAEMKRKAEAGLITRRQKVS